MDFRKKRDLDPAPLYINGVCVERVKSFKFLRVVMSDDLSRSMYTMATVKRARQRLHFLRPTWRKGYWCHPTGLQLSLSSRMA